MAIQPIFFLDFPLNKLTTDRYKDDSERKLTFKTKPIIIPSNKARSTAIEVALHDSVELVIKIPF